MILRVVFWVKLYFNLKGCLFLDLLLGLKFCDLLSQADLSSVDISGNSGDLDNIRVNILGRNTDIHVKLVHHLANTNTLLSNDVSMELIRDSDLSCDWDKLQECIGSSFTVLLLACDADDVGVGRPGNN